MFLLKILCNLLPVGGPPVEETACNVCLDIFAEWRVKQNDVALSVPAWLLCYMWHDGNGKF